MALEMELGMDLGMELGYDPIESLRVDGAAFVETVEAHDDSLHVPSCPGWTLGDLAYHQGEVWHFWSRVVLDGIDERGRLQTIEVPPEARGDELVAWLGAMREQIVSALTNADVDAPVWTWTGANRTVGWVRRRMAQEVAVHRCDASAAVGGEHRIASVVAADGIDEFLMWFAGRERREGELKPGGTVHLHCTDGDLDAGNGEWFVSSLKEPSCTFTRKHRKGDAAVRGAAHDLLLWLWRRSATGVEIIGDEKVARRFRAYTDLD